LKIFGLTIIFSKKFDRPLVKTIKTDIFIYFCKLAQNSFQSIIITLLQRFPSKITHLIRSEDILVLSTESSGIVIYNFDTIDVENTIQLPAEVTSSLD
jgi:hypothetical protein